jgi:NADH:ubiquinone oxidoreductase subunit 6 (subunit J)
MALLAALHVLRPDLDPSWRFISDYELGPFGWMMRLAFACLAASCLALCAAIWQDARGIAGYLGMAMVVVAACGMILAAIFVPDKVNRLHEVGAIIDQVPFAAPLINWQLWWHARWKPYRPVLAATAGLPLLGLAVFIVAMIIMLPRGGGQPGPEVLVGWPNRLMILAHCAWLMPLAWIAWRNAKK